MESTPGHLELEIQALRQELGRLEDQNLVLREDLNFARESYTIYRSRWIEESRRATALQRHLPDDDLFPCGESQAGYLSSSPY